MLDMKRRSVYETVNGFYSLENGRGYFFFNFFFGVSGDSCVGERRGIDNKDGGSNWNIYKLCIL